MEVFALLAVVALMLFVLLVMSGLGTWWMPWPFLGLGAVLLAPVFGLLVLFAPFVVLFAIAKAVFSKSSPSSRTRKPSPSPVASRHQTPPAMPESGRAPDAMGVLIGDGEAKVDAMRRCARRIPKPDVRAQALAICAAADQVLAVLPETGDEGLARDVVSRYLAPAETIFSRYARLATRGVAAAEPALARVEDEDLPFIERKLADLYERLHRGDLIDLEVAREMLAFDFATAHPPSTRA